MFNTRQFSVALRRHIAEQYSDGEIFTLFDLTDIAESFGKPSRAVAYILRAMHRKGQLKVVGELVNKNGGSNTKRYTVIDGAPVQLKTCRDYQIEAAQRQQSMEKAALALQAALDRMTRREVAVFNAEVRGCAAKKGKSDERIL